jgi:Zn-dependent peptidase ImmA (M78 family)
MGKDEFDHGPKKKLACHLASELIKDAGIKCAPVSLVSVIQHLQTKHNLDVVSDYFSQKISGLLVTSMKEGVEYATIGFNKNHHWNRRRFTIAHEIGHLLLRHSCVPIDGKKSHNEREADLFASELLMPPAIFRDDFKRLRDIPSLAQLYRVSPQALTIRLKELRLV